MQSSLDDALHACARRWGGRGERWSLRVSTAQQGRKKTHRQTGQYSQHSDSGEQGLALPGMGWLQASLVCTCSGTRLPIQSPPPSCHSPKLTRRSSWTPLSSLLLELTCSQLFPGIANPSRSRITSRVRITIEQSEEAWFNSTFRPIGVSEPRFLCTFSRVSGAFDSLATNSSFSLACWSEPLSSPSALVWADPSLVRHFMVLSSHRLPQPARCPLLVPFPHSILLPFKTSDKDGGGFFSSYHCLTVHFTVKMHL